MANEDDNMQQDDNQQQNDSQQLPLTGNDAAWDAQLESFMKETDREDRAPVAGAKQGEEGTQQGDEGQNKKPVATKQPASEGDDTQQQRQGNAQDQQVRPPSSQTKQYGNLFRTNARGDIVDARGAVVAPSGGARAIFHKLWPHIDHFEQRAAAAETRLQNYEAANKIAKDAGLTIEDQSAALTLMTQWKKSPKETIKTMLQLAQNGGIDVSDIVQGGGGFDSAAVKQMFEELIDSRLTRFDPLVNQLQQQQQDSELNDVAQQRYDEFIEQFPDAKVHEDSIANVMRDKNVDGREAYYLVRLFATQNGLDWSKPLAPQAVALQQRQQNERPSGGGVDRDLPDMRGRGGNANDTVKADSRGFANVDDSYDQIAREVFEEHGFKLQ